MARIHILKWGVCGSNRTSIPIYNNTLSLSTELCSREQGLFEITKIIQGLKK